MSLGHQPKRNVITAFVGTIAILCIYFLIQLSVISFLTEYETMRSGFDPDRNLATGFMLSIALLASVPICILFIMLLMGPVKDIRERLDLSVPESSSIIKWLSLTLLAGLIYISASLVLQRPLVNEFMLYVSRTAYYLPLFFVSVCLVGPIFEELLFREFLFRPFAESGAGPLIAITLTSIIWAGIHVQYGLFDRGYILLLGILLGSARHMTGSMVMPYIMHALNNLLSLTLVIYLRSKGYA